MRSSFCRRNYSTFFIFLVSFFLISAASACPPEENKNDKEKGDPVSVTSGRLNSSYQDISIPGRGELSLEITRNYYGRTGHEHEYYSPFGFVGWSFNYGMNIYPHGLESVTLINEEGQREIYNWDDHTRAWIAPKGNFSTLAPRPGEDGWILTRKDGKKYRFGMFQFWFSAFFKLVNITDRNGNQINLTYVIIDGLPRLERVTDDCGRSLVFSYNADELISSITWPNNEITTYEYDGSKLIKVTDPEGNSVHYSYSLYDFYNGFLFEDIWPQLTAITDANNNVTSFSLYDENPVAFINYLKCKRITYADGARMDFVYNESLRFTLVTDERGYTTRYDYDGNESVTVVTDPKGNAVTTAYDADLNRKSVTDAKDHTTYYTYDDKGNCLSIRDPLSRVSGFTYEPNFCFVKTATDAKGNTTTYYYDYEEALLGDLNGDGITNQANGNVVKIVYPAVEGGTPTELFVYNQYGQIIQQTAASGVIAKYDYYSATGYLEEKTADYGQINAVTRFEYDTLGNVTSVTDPLGNTTTSEYNKIGLLIKSVSPPPFNYQTKYYYDGNKNLIRTERQVGQ